MKSTENKKAWVIKKFGKSTEAFEEKEIQLKPCESHEVVIEVECFGLNFADIIARLGQYQDCPPLPAVVGYEVVGHVIQAGSLSEFKIGERVLAFTRFGGYATHVVVSSVAVVRLNETDRSEEVLALATQYSTAFYAGVLRTQLRKNENVVIHAAAGGVGTALVQLALHHQANVFAIISSPQKKDYLKSLGLNETQIIVLSELKQISWDQEVRRRVSSRHSIQAIKPIQAACAIHVIFDSIGGKTFRQGVKLLAPGGRIIGFGAADLSSTRNPLSFLIKGLQFGIYHPGQFLMANQSLIGINMLRLADHEPEVLSEVMKKVMDYYRQGIFKPQVGRVFEWNEIAQAHDYLESRKSVGKVVVRVRHSGTN